MRQYRIIAQIYLILSILNIVLAAPVAVRRIHEARGDDVTAMRNESGKLPVDAAGGSTSSGYPTPSSPNALAVASPQHSPSLDAAASSGYPTPHLSRASSVSGYSRLLERPPRLSPNRPGSPHASASSGSLSSQHVPASKGPQPSPTRFLSRNKVKFIADVAFIGLVIGGMVGLTRLSRHNDNDTGS